MPKISRNIKSFRNASGMTQEELAEKIHVTRQTVSSWETGRTQPDIDMLEVLADSLNAGIEELIYGKKNKVGLEPEKKDRNIFFILLSVIGTLITAAGLVLLLAAFWDKLEFLWNILAFAPLTAGFGTTAFAVTKRKKSPAWIEAGAAAWAAGLIATVALVNALYKLNADFTVMVLIDLLLIIPIILLIPGTVPDIAFFLGTFLFCTAELSMTDIPDMLISGAAQVILYGTGILFIRKYKGNPAGKKALILFAGLFMTAQAVIDLIFIAEYIDPLSSEVYMIFASISAVTGFIYLTSERIKALPAEKTAAVLMTLSAVITSFLIMADDSVHGNNGAYIFMLAAEMLLFAAGIAVNRSALKKEPMKIFIMLSALCPSFIVEIFALTSGERIGRLALLAVTVSLAMSVLLTVRGIRKASLMTANYGMLLACAVVCSVIIFSDFELLTKGIAVSVTGIAVLLTGYFLSKRLAAKNGKEADDNA